MASLTFKEKDRLEKLFQMDGGYVLDLSNRKFRELVLTSVGRDIEDEEYDYESGSKANRLRRFWQIEPDAVVARLILELIDYACSRRSSSGGVHSLSRECRLIAQRLLRTATAPREPARRSSGELESAVDPLDRVRRELVDALARAAYDSETAKLVAIRARFPREHLPEFKTASGFWGLVVEEIASGRGRLEVLAGEAVREYPHNQTLRDCHEALHRASGSTGAAEASCAARPMPSDGE